MIRTVSRAAFAAAAVALPAFAGAQIVNFDINGQQPGDPLGPTFVGVGAAGGGTTFNPISADSTNNNNAQTFSGVGALDSNGTPVSGFSFTTSPAGGDNNGAGTDPTSSNALTQDYLFVSGQATFTIDVPDTTTSAQIYFYTQRDRRFPIINVTGGTFNDDVDPVTGSDVPPNESAFFDVPVVTGGVITGTFDPGATGETISGFTVNAVPEPAALSLLALGGLGLLARRRRNA